MSSNEDDHNEGEGGTSHSKKRKIQRACDICRRKKIRCDGGQMPDNRCSNCIACGFDCTYVEAAKKRGPSKGYVEGLELKVDKMEKLIRQLCPDDSTFNVVMAAVENKSPGIDAKHLYPSTLSAPPSGSENKQKPGAMTILDSLTKAIRGPSQETFPEDEDDKIAYMLSERVRALRIEPSEYRFFGKSSGVVLIQRAIEARSNFIGVEFNHFNPIVGGFRPKFWTLQEWEKKPHLLPPIIPFEFPENDLILDLIALYFKNINLYMPLLHRPSFMRSLEDGLHLKDTSFALVVLLVCAVGSRFSDDPRTRLDEQESHSAGWKWFNQAIAVQKTFVSPHTLYDLQYYPIAVQFLSASAVPQACWSLVGIGLRVAQDIGAHRRGLPKLPSAEDELRKRAFWLLLVLDRVFGSSLGRPCGVQDEDFDLDLPIDCDDEYWDHEDPHQRFVQPVGKPSKVAAFISMIKLIRIVSVTLRTIYAINKSKVLFGYAGKGWEQAVIAELDSALNAWIDSLPAHLRWDPNREDEDFYCQSLALYANYYNTQIIIHRPFIPTPSRPSPISFPSMAICTSAARSCSHLVDLSKTKNKVPGVMIHGPVCTAALVLLLNLWSSKRTGIAQETVKKDMEDVNKCMEVLKASEDRYHSAGRLYDVLRHLADAGEFPLPEKTAQSSKKRSRGADCAGKGDETQHHKSQPSNQPRNIAGSIRATKDKSKPSPTPQHLTACFAQDTPSPQSSFSGSEVDSLLDQSSAFTTPANHPQQLHTGYSSDVGASPLGSGTFSLSDTQFSDAQSPTQHRNTTPAWYSFSSSAGPRRAEPLLPASQPLFASSFGSSNSAPMQPFSMGLNVDPSSMGPSMFNMDDSTAGVRQNSRLFDPPDPLQPGPSSMPLGDGMFASLMSLAGGSGIDPMLPMQQPFPDTLNAGMGPDLMDISVWSNSPAGLIFQDFAPYFTQMNVPPQSEQSQQQQNRSHF